MAAITNRNYKGRSDYLGAFGVAIAFTIVGILGVAFLVLDINFIGLKSWGYYLFIPAFFIWIGGFVSYFQQKQLEKEALAALDSYQSGTVTIETLMQDLMLKRDDLMRLLIELRTQGQIKFRIDSKSGDVIFGESFAPPISQPSEPTPAKTMYCPQCGVKIDVQSTFCSNCGSPVQ